MESLKQKYAWPQQKPNVPLDNQTMFGNEIPFAKVLNKNMKLIVELGSWLGASTRFILDTASNATVIAVDHWLGSAEHAQIPIYQSRLDHLYETFLVNCWKYKDRLIPLRNNTIDGLREIYNAGLNPDLVYVDASHDYESVLQDLETIYRYFPSTMITGDDWNWNYQNSNFPTRRAVIEFAKRHQFKITAENKFWVIVK